MAQPILRVHTGLPLIKERVARLFLARRDGKADDLLTIFAPECSYRLICDPRLFPKVGPFYGHTEILESFRACDQILEYIDTIVVDMIVDERRAVVRRHATIRSRETGNVGEFEIADLLEFRDGMITKMTQFVDTASLGLLVGRI
ncbi:nuclear transport factor 2 family protein [Phreatobacter aquaticus]|uniref:Nuclear transport factor 2 family protein n=1 Tax=Phreatobacter aquaticus TaxID=2570229 RepID=A0A4D7QDY0_9HYPH|nr:nuclear transport factor 2 family protein [Phreatobacter aquaticus]QCK86210.1 nuclear transport factor 2 family protein [Phreatobacter aquaticus]